MVEKIKIPFRFDKLNAYQKEDIAKTLENFGCVSEPIDVGLYTNFYLYTETVLDDEYRLKGSLEGKTQVFNGIQEYLKTCLKLIGYQVY